MTKLFATLLRFVMATITKYNIDESHGLGHSMNVLNYANQIYEKEQYTFPPLKQHEDVIYVAAAVHDMCDNKYMSVEEGKAEIDGLLTKIQMKPMERKAVLDIIGTMSYSKVIQNGFPYLGEYQRAYHVVREADLLSAYDFDRCMTYKMYSSNDGDLRNAFEDAEALFHKRMFRHKVDGLLTTKYAQDQHPILVDQAKMRIETWRKLIPRLK